MIVITLHIYTMIDVANAITLSNNDDGVGHVLELVANVLQEKLQQSLQP